MADFKIPDTFPDCHLLHVLADKAGERHDTTFNFLGRLDEFRERVSQEVRQINDLFPEYTPHDEQYHLSRLFHVADTVLGRNLIEGMNSAELFVLAIALYGHDWGMAVSEAEKQYIVVGEQPGETVVNLLPDEHARFVAFARKERLGLDKQGHLPDIPVEKWREYVRQTHAFRSAERVRRFFEPIDMGVADAASRSCVGHWLTFEELQDHKLYPPDLSILRETVNVRAVAVYVRLVDLLDLADDRAPYAIWKFVAPRDPRSKMEWLKHRALRPVTCPSYQHGRVVQVDGSTDDHEVYAALEDLKNYGDEQLRGCNDLLARMNDSRHRLDLYHIEWRVAAREFKPVSIRFEFNRRRMFDILSDEIYQGDPYVFLRELLQNSIDAIRMRREVLTRWGLAPGDMGVIQVTVKHGHNGDAKVTWRDDGIGMDEYVVRNYLAVAGQSYYCSADFERERLKMDPISRFGIGLLSCFMVADRVEIETFKDPYLPPAGEPLKIAIPAAERQFRVEARPVEAAHVGTTVTVFVEGGKLPTEEDDPVKPLDVTNYISTVAGFVEFPVVITEGDRRTIVLHPKQDAAAARRRFGEQFEVSQIDLSYPWEEVFLPQDQQASREVLREERLDIADDLALAGYAGVLTCLVPLTRDLDLCGIGSTTCYGEGWDGAEVWRRGQADLAGRIRWHPSWNGSRAYLVAEGQGGVGRSASHAAGFEVYRDGVLVAAAPPPQAFCLPGVSNCVPQTRLVVNLPKSRTALDVARTQLVGRGANWAEPVYEAYLQHLWKMSGERLLTMAASERWHELGRFLAFHGIEPESLCRLLPRERWPLLFLEKGGSLAVEECGNLPPGPIYACPDTLVQEATRVAWDQWVIGRPHKGPLSMWRGETCVLWGDGERFGSSLWGAFALQSTKLEEYDWARVRFLRPPWAGGPPLLQYVLVAREAENTGWNWEDLLQKACRDPALLTPMDLRLLQFLSGHGLSAAFPPTLNDDTLLTVRDLRNWRFASHRGLPSVAEFSSPFAGFFAYGNEVWNLKHPLTRVLLRLRAGSLLSRLQRTLSAGAIGRMEDAFASLFCADDARQFYREWPAQLRNLCLVACEVGLCGAAEVSGAILKPDDIILGSLELDRMDYQWATKCRKLEKPKPFGQALS
ncbi:MAG: ATP-binding protein [Chloroflexi bacterium]|nr:ATP-binding protein [Chloroflexota bacterium]